MPKMRRAEIWLICPTWFSCCFAPNKLDFNLKVDGPETTATGKALPQLLLTHFKARYLSAVAAVFGSLIFGAALQGT